MECCVRGCSGDSNFGILGFYNFPRDNLRKLEWLNAIGLLEKEINVWSALCSRHFPEECFKFTHHGMLLKMDATPDVMVIGSEKGISDNLNKRKHSVIVYSTATVRITKKCKNTETDNLKQVEEQEDQSHMDIIKEIISEYNSDLTKKEHLYILESKPGKIKEDLMAIRSNGYNIQLQDEGDDHCNNAYDSDTIDTKDVILQDVDIHYDRYTETQKKSSEAIGKQPEMKDVVQRALQSTIDGEASEENYLIIENNKEPKTETVNTREQNSESKKRSVCKLRHVRMAPVSDTMETQYLTVEQQLQKIKDARESNEFLNNSHRCYKCGMSFKTEFHYRQHMIRHDKNFGTFECTVCNSYYSTKDKLFNHTLLKHRIRYRCKLCNFETATRHFANIHNCGTTEAVTFPCNLCNKVFSKVKSLYSHKQFMHKSDDYVCSICGSKFHNSKGLAVHYSICESQDLECQSCRHKFRNEQELTLHRQVHYLTCRTEAYEPSPGGGEKQRKPLRCEPCNKNFKTRHTLIQHLKFSSKHIKPEAYIFQCSECSSQFSRKNELIDHLQIHTNEWRHRCPICDKTFKSGPVLYIHKRYVHGGGMAKVHPCPHCDKRFTSSWKLRVHIRSHTGQKPFICDICGNKYSSNCSLTQHMKGVHLKIKYARAPRNKRIKKEICSTLNSE